MSYSKGYIQGERSFNETVQTCCKYPQSERTEASKQIMQATERFKHICNRKQDSDDGSN